jgi:hypothetical protein
MLTLPLPLYEAPIKICKLAFPPELIGSYILDIDMDGLEPTIRVRVAARVRMHLSIQGSLDYE